MCTNAHFDLYKIYVVAMISVEEKEGIFKHLGLTIYAFIKTLAFRHKLSL